MKNETIKSLNELIHSRYFESFESDKLGNQLFIEDPERANRIHEAAESGCDGSTHGEHIDDWREANKLAEREVYRPMFESMGFDSFCAESLAETLRDSIADEIDETEAFHKKHGTLETQCG